MCRLSRADDRTGTDHEDRPLSRRAALQQLGALGLLVAGGIALDPFAAAAKPKKKRRKRKPRRHKPQAQQPAPPQSSDGAALVAPPGGVVADDPVVADPGEQPDNTFIETAHLTVTRWRRGWKVRVEVRIHYGEADAAAIRQGARGRLTCEIWEKDDNNLTIVNPQGDDFVFAFPGIVVPSSGTRGLLVFEREATKNTLDRDVPNPNADEIIGLLTLTTPAGRLLSRTTNMVKVIRY